MIIYKKKRKKIQMSLKLVGKKEILLGVIEYFIKEMLSQKMEKKL